MKEKDFVSEAISDLIVNRCVEVLDFPPAKAGKKRLILDLSLVIII